MKIHSVFDPEFAPYGRIPEGFREGELLKVMEAQTEIPAEGTVYVASSPELEATEAFQSISLHVYGGFPTQLGYFNGSNHVLDAMEYHRGSESIVSSKEVIIPLALQSDMTADFHLDSAKVKLFRVPAGVPILLYESTLHHAPMGDGFRIACAQPRGTNTVLGQFPKVTSEDRLLVCRNTWLIAHPQSDAAKYGAYVGIDGENIRL